ncbi:hypothetical protein TNCV_4549121 [Trichonephila clavipes]|nr:hypothetical protein TNCV_4549121 [Trichonephila clavipes]
MTLVGWYQALFPLQDNVLVIHCSCLPRAATINLSNSCTYGLEGFPHEVTLLLVPKSSAALVKLRLSSSFPIILPHGKTSR